MTDYRKKSVIYTFGFLHPSRNITERTHPLKRNKQKNKFMNDVAMEIKAQGLVKFEGQVKIFVDLCFKNKLRRDIDNYSPKWLLDALVKSEVILDDNKNIIPESPSLMMFDNEPEAEMVIKIEEIV